MTSLRIGRSEEFPPETMRVLRLLGRAVAVRRDATGLLTARELSCRHQGADLSAGVREGTVVTCPRHGWRYDLETGRCLTDPDFPLRRLEIFEEEGFVRLRIDRQETT
ncbi:MAG: Rieske (2Fe-2S) protein [Thermoanaerobaculia bacterium]